MSILPHKNKPSNDPDNFDAGRPIVSELGKRIFFVTGERGCGKSTFLAALIQKFNLQPSGFITKREAPPECAVYMHQVVTVPQDTGIQPATKSEYVPSKNRSVLPRYLIHSGLCA